MTIYTLESLQNLGNKELLKIKEEKLKEHAESLYDKSMIIKDILTIQKGQAGNELCQYCGRVHIFSEPCPKRRRQVPDAVFQLFLDINEYLKGKKH